MCGDWRSWRGGVNDVKSNVFVIDNAGYWWECRKSRRPARGLAFCQSMRMWRKLVNASDWQSLGLCCTISTPCGFEPRHPHYQHSQTTTVACQFSIGLAMIEPCLRYRGGPLHVGTWDGPPPSCVVGTWREPRRALSSAPHATFSHYPFLRVLLEPW